MKFIKEYAWVMIPVIIGGAMIYGVVAMERYHPINWVPDRRPETAEERKAVAAEEERLLSHIPASLAGHDQDWDDVIAQAHCTAVQTCCATRLYEFKGRVGYTGRMKEIQNDPPTR